MERKLNIFYIHYNIQGNDGKNRPEWFDFEKCYSNLLNSISGWEDFVTINIVMQGQNKNNWIEKYYNTNIKYFDSIDGYENYRKGWEWAIACEENNKNNDLYYFLENDYLHVKGWVGKIFNLYSKYNLDSTYVSLYDHNDKYNHPIYNDLVSKIFVTDSHHWRSTPSTCGSYIISGKLLLEDKNTLYEYRGDHNKFIELNKTKGRTVISPIPGLSTHCMKGLLSPTIDWKKQIWI